MRSFLHALSTGSAPRFLSDWGGLLLTLLVLLLAQVPALPAYGEIPPLPEGLASFGATLADGYVYIYGGHVGKTHQHSRANVSPHFRRLALDHPELGWQDLGAVPGLQGLPLVNHRGQICRIGGMTADNAEGEPDDLHSVADVACYQPASGEWRELPPLPAPRSSHDAVILDDRLYVIGGWQLNGARDAGQWHDTLAILDLTAAVPVWRSLPQPFKRRALAVATAGGKVYAIGGIDADGTSLRFDVFDPATETWQQGPDLPIQGERLKGFGSAALGFADRILLSGIDGLLHTFDPAAGRWEPNPGHFTTGRFFHRLLHHDQTLLLIGGSDHNSHLATVETFQLAAETGVAPSVGPATSTAALPTVTANAASLVAAVPAVERGEWPGFRRVEHSRAQPTRW